MLLCSAAALSAYAIMPPAQNSQEKLAEVTRISAAPDRILQPSLSVAVAAGASQSAQPAQAVAPAPSTWSTVVTTDQQEQNRKQTAKLGDAATNAQLARDIQTQLQRVGCYGGEITGTWTPQTKTAMSAFMDRVNATLPVDEPDYILLMLVQGHKSQACSAECKSGEVAVEGGRCLPKAVVAQNARKTQRAAEAKVASLNKSGTSKTHITVASNEPKPRPVVETPQKPLVAQPKALAAAGPEVLPWATREPNPAKPRPDPLPGMMAVGARPAPANQTWPGVAAPTSPPVPVPTLELPQEQLAANIPGEPAQAPVIPKAKPGSKSKAAGARPGAQQKKFYAARRSSPNSYAPRPKRPRTEYASASQPRYRRFGPSRGSVQYTFIHPLGGFF